jgi:N-acetylneuraminate synthase
LLYFIADIASNHDNDIQRAYKLIEQAKEAGANAVKFQYFRADTIISPKGFETIGKQAHQKVWKKSIYDTYRDYELNIDWIPKLKDHADKYDIDFLCTCYDLDACDEINYYVPMWKIGSGDITYRQLLEKIACFGKPIILSTGASNIEDICDAYKICRRNEIIMMQCNTNYELKKDDYKYMNLKTILKYREWFTDKVGLSDHTKHDNLILSAITLGATYFEKHFTDGLSNSPDNNFSLNKDEWSQMINNSYNLFNALGDGKKKIEGNEKKCKSIQRRSYFLKIPKTSNEILKYDDVIALRPFIPGALSTMEDPAGYTLKVDKKGGEPLLWSDLHIGD